MRQVAAGREVEAHEGVARLQQRQEDRLVGLGAAMRLDIGEAAAEQLRRPLDRQRLGHVDILAAAIVAAAGIALGVLVGQDRALGLEHRAGDDVLRGDQLDPVLLPAELLADRGGQFRVGLGEGGGEETLGDAVGGGLVHGIGPGRLVSTVRRMAGKCLARRRCMPAALEFGRQEGGQRVERHLRPGRAGAEAGDVGVVMGAGHARLGGRSAARWRGCRHGGWRRSACRSRCRRPARRRRALPASTAAQTWWAKSG